MRRLVPPLALGALAAASPLLPAPLAAAAFFPALAAFPGLAVATLLQPGAPAAARWGAGLAAGPLLAAAAGGLLLRAGAHPAEAAGRIALGAWALWLAFEARAARRRATPAAGAGMPGGGGILPVAFAAGLALLVAVPPLVNPWVRVHSDTWVHAGITWEVLQHGVPPVDPRFAGMPLNFVWFYNLFAALAAAPFATSPFLAFSLLNLSLALATSLLAWLAGFALWGDRSRAFSAAFLVVLGYNAGAWLLWPLRLARAAFGEQRGAAEALRIAGEHHLGTTAVLHDLAAPFARMVSFLDKYLIGSSLGSAWVAMLLLLWGALLWLGHRRPAGLAWASLGAAGTLFFHGVVGLSVVPAACAACVAAALPGPWRATAPPVRRLAALAAALAAGGLAALPYTLAISGGWAAERSGFEHSYLHVGWLMPWTLATSCAVAFALAVPGLRRALGERRTGATWLALHGLGMLAFALCVHLPLSNEHKFAFLVFVPLALLGAGALPGAAAAAARRWGRARTVAVAAVLFGTTPALTLAGYLADPTGATDPRVTLSAEEAALYRWIREETPLDAVFVDDRSRDLVMVHGRRRMLAGTTFGPELAAFPAAALAARRAAQADLYGPVARLDEDVATLRGAGGRAFVVYRDADRAPGAEPWRALDGDPRFSLRYRAGGFRVYALEALP